MNKQTLNDVCHIRGIIIVRADVDFLGGLNQLTRNPTKPVKIVKTYLAFTQLCYRDIA